MTNNPSRTQDHAARGTQHTTHKRRWEWLATGGLVLAVVLGIGGFLALRIRQGTLNDRLRESLSSYDSPSEVSFRLLQQGASLNIRGADGITPLLLAVEQNNQAMVEFLLQRGVDANSRDRAGRTALAVALANNRVALARLLLQACADPRDPGGILPPLQAAAYATNVEMAHLLLQRGADVNVVNREGETALMSTRWTHASNQFYPMARFLIDQGLDVNARSPEGRTALMETAYKGDLQVVRLLLRHGANVNAADRNGWTALEVAGAHPEIGQTLRAAGGRKRHSRHPLRFPTGRPLVLNLNTPFPEPAWRRLFRYITQTDR